MIQDPISISAEYRERYAVIADLIVPSASGMPSASEADVAMHWIDVALSIRQDLIPVFREAVAACSEDPADRSLRNLSETSPTVFNALCLLTVGAYYLNPDVRAAINYPGQEERQLDPLSTRSMSLLERVFERGPLYRST